MDVELQQNFYDRENLMRKAKQFLNDHADLDGKLSPQAQKTFDALEQRIIGLTNEIDRQMFFDNSTPNWNDRKDTPPILKGYPIGGDNPFASSKSNVVNGQFGIIGNEYKQRFIAQCREGFRVVDNILQTSPGVQGGYLIPSEMHSEIITKLTEENIFRQISRVIQTQSEHKLAIQTTPPTASFIAEGQSINMSTEGFSQRAINAYKLAAGVSVTNELLFDSAYDLETHLNIEFAKSIASEEERALVVGTGNGEPCGILTHIANYPNMQLQSSSANAITSDDIINLVYSLPRPYRKNACFITNDSTLAAIRKLKDSTQNYLWTPNLTADEPSQLLGYRVFTSAYMPNISSGEMPVLFGDFSKLIIGMRGNLVFKPLRELHALQDLTSFLMIERFDSVLSDDSAVKALKIK